MKTDDSPTPPAERGDEPADYLGCLHRSYLDGMAIQRVLDAAVEWGDAEINTEAGIVAFRKLTAALRNYELYGYPAHNKWHKWRKPPTPPAAERVLERARAYLINIEATGRLHVEVSTMLDILDSEEGSDE